jgi:hypothetical protein
MLFALTCYSSCIGQFQHFCLFKLFLHLNRAWRLMCVYLKKLRHIGCDTDVLLQQHKKIAMSTLQPDFCGKSMNWVWLDLVKVGKWQALCFRSFGIQLWLWKHLKLMMILTGCYIFCLMLPSGIASGIWLHSIYIAVVSDAAPWLWWKGYCSLEMSLHPIG